MRLVTAQVTEAFEPTQGVQRLGVVYSDTQNNMVNGVALSYEQFAASCKQGDTVLINTTGVDLKLGTGGVSFVVANLSAVNSSNLTSSSGVAPSLDPELNPELTSSSTAASSSVVLDKSAPSGAHIIKLRYTPYQHEVLSVEEPASPYHEIMQNLVSLERTPVICCELHSQVPLVAAALKTCLPNARVVYCMSDQAALPASFSTLLAQMRSVGLLDASITCGQAFGGDFEAVNLYSGLLAAFAVCDAHAIVCSQGPGLAGTATRFGHGGLSQAEALNAAYALEGTPIATLRLSFAEQRARHQGVSHHSLTVLSKACLARALIPLPINLPANQEKLIKQQLSAAGIFDRHEVRELSIEEAGIDLRSLTVTTMGRTQQDDPAFFSAAFAAGIVAAQLLV